MRRIWYGSLLLAALLPALLVIRARRPAEPKVAASSVETAGAPEHRVAGEQHSNAALPRQSAHATGTAPGPSASVLRGPHPITPDHVARFREADIVHAAWQALEKRDFARARELIAAYRRDFPGARPDVDEGLETLAACMEQPSQATLARAEEFYHQRTASVLRRRLRRHCLEPAGSGRQGSRSGMQPELVGDRADMPL